MKVFKENNDLYIGKVRNGSGILTKRSFAAGERIFQVTGPLITCDEDDAIDEQTRSNTYRFTEDLFINPKGKVGDFLNHSCNPNARVAKAGEKLFVEAIKQIPKRKEVLIDYSTIIAADDIWTMQCNCGSGNCRKKIGRFKLLPKELKEAYKAAGVVPAYILEIR